MQVEGSAQPNYCQVLVRNNLTKVGKLLVVRSVETLLLYCGCSQGQINLSGGPRGKKVLLGLD